MCHCEIKRKKNNRKDTYVSNAIRFNQNHTEASAQKYIAMVNKREDVSVCKENNRLRFAL